MTFTELLFPSNEKKSDKIQMKNVIVLICAYLLIGFMNYTMKGNYNFV